MQMFDRILDLDEDTSVRSTSVGDLRKSAASASRILDSRDVIASRSFSSFAIRSCARVRLTAARLA